jgi:NAD(P)-dependent dehydrogenase (short-subunit alcohol dehydrogenase family)
MNWGPFDLSGKVVLVTGSAMGIGFGIAARCREAGASVFVADIDGDAAQLAVTRLEALPGPGRISSMHADVSDPSATAEVIAKCVADLRGIDVLVNNAGIYPITPLADITPQLVNRIMQINVHSVLYMTSAFAAQVKRQRSGGAIVNLASMEAFHPSFVGMTAYGASKGAVVSLTKHAALELAPLRIRVNAIAPGAIRTEGTAKTSAGGGLTETERQSLADAMSARIPVGRLGEPDDIATVAVFLASSAAGYITGQTILTDGGLLLA